MEVTVGYVVASTLVLLVAAQRKPPNIIVILADDLGWNDVSFHGSNQIPTPNIDALAYNGIILNNHYTPALCTPSRSAFLTGKYPIHTGMQHDVILENEPWGLDLKERLLPEVLNKAGYRSHAVGKWHLGFFKKEYTPTFRGFHSHYGYWQGFHDYYNHTVKATLAPMEGFDMRRNLDADWNSVGHYSTDLFTDEAVKIIRNHESSRPLFLYFSHLAPHTGSRIPFQAPPDLIARFSHIADPERRIYAAMVSKVDESVGEVMAALASRDMLGNSIIIFMSDNGAPTYGGYSNRGSNFPLRGIKFSVWEGGNRVAAAIWSPLLKKQQRVSHQMMYMTDWMPTLVSAAGLVIKELGNIDGIDMWGALSNNEDSPRTEFVYNIDDHRTSSAAVRYGKWKYISETRNFFPEWYGETGRDANTFYNGEEVMMSKTGVVLSYITKNKIQQKIRFANVQNSATDEKDTSEYRLLNITTMLRLRKEAELICKRQYIKGFEIDCRPWEAPCLFNIEEDPCERRNLATSNPDILQMMHAVLMRYRDTVVEARNKPGEESANPIYWNNTWSCWHDEPLKHNNTFSYGYLALLICIGLLIFFLISALIKKVFAKKMQEDSPKTISVFTVDQPRQPEQS